MEPNPSPSSAQVSVAKQKPPRRFVVSACLTGFLFLGISAVFFAEAIHSIPKGLLIGLGTALMWTYYVLRPKSRSEMWLNSPILLACTFGLALIAFAISPKQIELMLLYWALAVLGTFGLPVLVLLAVLFINYWICAAAAERQAQDLDAR